MYLPRASRAAAATVSGVTLRALLVLLVLLLASGPAAADGWTDARGDFREDFPSKSWKERAAAFLLLVDWDSAKAVQEVLAATLKDKNAGGPGRGSSDASTRWIRSPVRAAATL